jgi:hypothetical protein
VAAYHYQRYRALDAEVHRKVLEVEQAKQALRQAAGEAGNNPAGGLLLAFATFGGSPEVNALAVEREHQYVQFLRFGGPGAAVAVAALVWAWVVRRLGRAAPIGRVGREQGVLGVAAGLIGAAAAGLFLLLLHASNIALDETGPALAPWWLAAAVGIGFAVCLARPRERSAYLFAAAVAVLATVIAALYANSSDAVALVLGFGTSTAEENWYLGASVVVAFAAVVFLRLATPRIEPSNNRAEPVAEADSPRE